MNPKCFEGVVGSGALSKAGISKNSIALDFMD